MANGLFGGGIGTLDDPYLVEDISDLLAIRTNLSAAYLQSENLDLSGVTDWTPLGTESDFFNGSYDGGGYEILNFNYITENYYASFFGDTVNATVTNVIFVDPFVSGIDYAGVVSGYSRSSTFKNCLVKNAVMKIGNGDKWSGDGGGFVAYAESCDFTDCHVTGEITTFFGGGFGGDVYGCHLVNCSTDVVVLSTAGGYDTAGFFGGIYAFSEQGTDTRRSRFEKCHTKFSAGGDITSEASPSIAGFAAYAGGTDMNDCYAIVDIPNGGYVGGIYGLADGCTIENVYATGNIAGYQIGGIVPEMYMDWRTDLPATLKNSYNLLSNMKVINYEVPWEYDGESGIEYYNDGLAYEITLESDEVIIENCYALDDIPINYEMMPQGIALSKSDAKTREHYKQNGWTFGTVWKILEGVTYPTFDNTCIALPLQSIALVK